MTTNVIFEEIVSELPEEKLETLFSLVLREVKERGLYLDMSLMSVEDVQSVSDASEDEAKQSIVETNYNFDHSQNFEVLKDLYSNWESMNK